MNNFCLVKQIDPQAYLDEANAADMWLLATGRQKLKAQLETNTISLRTADPPRGFVGKGWDIHEVKDDQIDHFPLIKKFLYAFAAEQGTTPARAMIVRLRPWGQVYRHMDYGPYYRPRDRYHLVLASTGSDLTSGDESAVFYPGDVFWFNNDLEHQAFNHSPTWRVHVIFDVNDDARKKKAGA
jgi:hypothetical protein